jgi:hypothetical protein
MSEPVEPSNEVTVEPVEPSRGEKLDALAGPAPVPYGPEEFGQKMVDDPRMAITIQNFEAQFKNMQDNVLICNRLLMALCEMNHGRPLIVTKQAMNKLGVDDKLKAKNDPGGRGWRLEVVGPKRETKE